MAEKKLADKIAEECGEHPDEYEIRREDIPNLEKHTGSDDAEIDMSADELPVDFEEIDLDACETVR